MLEEFLRAWVPLMVSILALGTAGWNILNGPARKNADVIKALGDSLITRLEKLDARQDVTEREVSNLKTVITQMPDKDSMHRLELGQSKMSGQIETLSERLKPIDALSRRLQEVLLERTAK